MLKTTNYYIKELNYTLTHACAAIRDIVVKGETGYAIFVIHTNRENCEGCIKGKLIPFTTYRVDFKVDRNVCDRITAYNAAKTEMKTITKMVNNELVEVEEKGTLNGWKDDIIQ